MEGTLLQVCTTHTHTQRPLQCYPFVEDGVVMKGSQKCYIAATRLHQRQDLRGEEHDLFCDF